jgi:hypothetical protein
MKFTLKYVNLDAIKAGRNVRLKSLMKIEELATDIHENGLITPLNIFEVSKGEFMIVAGHRRHAACSQIANEEPLHFKTLFPNGIPCNIVTGISLQEAEAMKVDHGNEVGLQDPMELQLCANILFGMGCTEKQVVIRLASLMDRIKPMKSDKKKKYLTMLADAELWKEKGNMKAYNEKIIEANTFIFNNRRGMVQNLHKAFRCPNIVMAALFFKATHERPDKESGFSIPESEKLPMSLTYEDVTKLHKCFESDLLEVKDGVSIYSKMIPGPLFQAKWAEIMKDYETKEAASESSTPRAKAMSADDLAKESKKWLSAGFQLLCKSHRKDEVDAIRLNKSDRLCFVAETMSERAPDEWKAIETLFDAIVAEQTAAVKEVAASK